MQVQPGTHRAKIVDCGMKNTAAGKDVLFVTFETDEPRGRLNWFGHMNTEVGKSGKSALQISIESLINMGFNDNWDAFQNGGDLTCFEDPFKSWEIVVVDEEYNGKTMTKIKWVNDPERPRGIDRMDRAESATVVQSKNLKGLSLQIRAELGFASKKKPQLKAVDQAKLDDQIPF